MKTGEHEIQNKITFENQIKKEESSKGHGQLAAHHCLLGRQTAAQYRCTRVQCCATTLFVYPSIFCMSPTLHIFCISSAPSRPLDITYHYRSFPFFSAAPRTKLRLPLAPNIDSVDAQQHLRAWGSSYPCFYPLPGRRCPCRDAVVLQLRAVRARSSHQP